MTPMIRSAHTLLLACTLAVPVLAGCQGETSQKPQIWPLRNMHDQQRYDPQQESTFFPDGRTMRPEIPHTFAREMETDARIGKGRLLDDSGYVLTIPEVVTERLGGGDSMLARGQERFNIYCRPCHDGTGSGNGLAVQRGMTQPPSFHDVKLRTIPDGQLFATISNGIRTMPPYKHNIPVDDRWAIVAYVRALQLSQADAKE